MSRKPYDELPWWYQLLWPWFGPPCYEEAEDLDVCLTAYWCALNLSAAELVKVDDQSCEEFIATVRCHHAPLAADDEDDSDIDHEPARSGEWPLVIGRDHPAWAEVDAEQRERLGEHDERETP